MAMQIPGILFASQPGGRWQGKKKYRIDASYILEIPKKLIPTSSAHITRDRPARVAGKAVFIPYDVPN